VLYINEKNVIIMSYYRARVIKKKSKNNCMLVYALEYNETIKAHAIAI
jgi:hypothetical protein